MVTHSTSGIYQILNTVNGKIYIGSALYLIKRCTQHRSDLRRNCHKNKYLQASWNLHSEEAFQFLLLEIVDDTSKLAEREQYWIDNSNCLAPEGYNLNKIANSMKGYKHSEETKAKISKGNKNKIVAEEVRIRYRKFDKWPHADGWKCKCDECRNKINEREKERRLVKRLASGKKFTWWPHKKGSKCDCGDCVTVKKFERFFRSLKQVEPVQGNA